MESSHPLFVRLCIHFNVWMLVTGPYGHYNRYSHRLIFNRLAFLTVSDLYTESIAKVLFIAGTFLHSVLESLIHH